MSGPGRRTARLGQRGSDHLRIPVPGSGPPSVDQLYRKAAHVGPEGGPEHRAAFRRLVAAVWPIPRPPRT